MKRTKTIMTMVAVAMVVVFSSCASIVSKSSYPVNINSHPSNAKISISDKKGLEIYSGTTPATVLLKASAGYFSRARYQVKFSSPGYEERTVFIESSIDGWYFGNILLGGFLGMLIIDPASGAMYKIDTEHLNVSLQPSTASSDPELNIIDINDIPDNWKDKLVKISE